MGYYIQTPLNKSKAVQIVAQNKGAMIIPQPRSFKDVEFILGLICVVTNEHFEAAAFCYNEKEFKEFTDPADKRPKIWVVMPRAAAEKACNFKG